jgi:mannose-6-phosphate isomerase-like protein (cupin superfamily)
MKKLFSIAFGIAALLPVVAAADDPHMVATVIPAELLDAVASAAPADRVSDESVRHVESAEGRLGIGVVHRPVIEAGGPVNAIRHHKQSEVYRVMAGRGILVTSSSMSDVRPLDPDGEVVTRLTGPSDRGVIEEPEAIQAIGEGDIVIIPAGVAHGFSEISMPITYMVVRVDPERLVALK